jgi:hypothetical protein
VDADGVLMVGTGLRCVGLLEALEGYGKLLLNWPPPDKRRSRKKAAA